MIRYFELIQAMFTGFNTAMNTMGTYMYAVAFGNFIPVLKLGYGSAIAIVMFILVVIFTLTIRLVFDREDLQY